MVRRGAVTIHQHGNIVATLERGSIFEICTLSDQYVTIHCAELNTYSTGNSNSIDTKTKLRLRVGSTDTEDAERDRSHSTDYENNEASSVEKKQKTTK